MINIKIDHVNYKSLGIGYHEGEKIFVPYVIEGEEVSLSITHKSKKYSKGKLLNIVSPSKDRIQPACKYYYKCGGCSLQHMNNSSYLNFKQNLLNKSIRRAGIVTDLVPEVIMIGPFSRRITRIKCKLSIGGNIKSSNIKFGYYQPNSNNLVDIDECVILEKNITNLFKPLRTLLKSFDAKIYNEVFEILISNCDNGIDILIICNEDPRINELELLADFAHKFSIARISWKKDNFIIPVVKRMAPYVKLGDVIVEIEEGNFLQASRTSQEIISKIIINYIEKNDEVLDLYSGCGTYSFEISKYASKVHSVEGAMDMVLSMKKLLNKVKNMTIERRDLYQFPFTINELNNYNIVIINPPRNGATPQIELIANSKIEKIIFISCDIENFSRDASILIKAGFRLISIKAVDQFYWTAQLEVIGIFVSG